jgi:hypothetical protein
MSSEPDLCDKRTEVRAREAEVIPDGREGVDVKLPLEAAREASVRLVSGCAVQPLAVGDANRSRASTATCESVELKAIF